MKKKYIVLLLLVCMILGGGLFVIRRTLDRTAPEIIFPEVQASYHKEDTEETLLKGVTAHDDTDGDVTDSLMVDNLFVDESQETVTVVYVAKDSNNNITKASRQMTLDPDQTETETETETESESEPEKVQSISDMMHAAQTESEAATETESEAVTEADTEEVITEAEAETEAVTETEKAAETAKTDALPEPMTKEQDPKEAADLDSYYEDAFSQLSAECPRLRLTDRKIEIAVGDEFDPLLYVQSIEDDVDNKYELWRQISIEGAVNTQVPGIYQLIYSANDLSGNTSNRAMLLVDVQGDFKTGTVSEESNKEE